MSDAPETIWLTHFLKDNCGAKLGRGTISDLDHGTEYPAYRRADLEAPDSLPMPPTTAQIMADPVMNALVEALGWTLDFVERHSNRWDGNGSHPSIEVDKARAALAQLKEPKP